MAMTNSVVLSRAMDNVGSSQEREGRLFNLHDFKSDLTSFYIMRGLTKQFLRVVFGLTRNQGYPIF